MKKATANKTVSVQGKVWVRGTVFESPYPPGVQSEIDAYIGKPNPTISEIEVPSAVSAPVLESEEPLAAFPPEVLTEEAVLETKEEAAGEFFENPPLEDDADKKKRLIAYAKEKFDVKIDGRKSLEDVETQISSLLEADLPAEDSENDSELNAI